MSRIARLICVLPFALALAACSVSVRDETPAKFSANPALNMYPIKVAVTRAAMVSPDDVYMTAFIDNHSYPLEADRTGNGWHTLYPIRCHGSFQLQYRVAWSVGGLSSDYKVVPDKPRTVEITQPALASDAKFDTKERSRKGWTGDVQYEFLTQQNTQISGLAVQPVSADPADVRQADDITVVTPAPVSASCDKPVDIELHSKAQRAQAYLVIDTDNPAVPHWKTKVEFAP
ncbi:MAG: hypothetical protein ACREUG_07230 [Steroidobacteraceae bacterium]